MTEVLKYKFNRGNLFFTNDESSTKSGNANIPNIEHSSFKKQAHAELCNTNKIIGSIFFYLL